jgi:coenzyme PQQ precursor peptide PqqA
LSDPTLNPLIPCWFDGEPHKLVNSVAPQHKFIPVVMTKDFTGEVFVPVSTRRAKMAWKTPKIVEVPVGMEINMYACAARK